jgi:hypothetical protein
MKVIYPTLSELVLFLTGCEFSSEIQYHEKPGIEELTKTYPAAIGNRWVYSQKWSYESFNLLDSALYPRGYRFGIGRNKHTFSIVNEVLGNDLLQDSSIHLVFGRPLKGGAFQDKSYFHLSDTGFSQIALKRIRDKTRPDQTIPQAQLPKNGIKLKTEEKDETDYFEWSLLDYLNYSLFDNVYTRTDGKSYFYKPRTVLKYPLEIGRKWLYHEEDSLKIKKKVVGIEDVTTPLGTFQCYKIEWIFERLLFKSTESIEVCEYIGSKGLIKRTAEERIALYSSYHGPEPIAYDIITEETVLTMTNF